MNGDISFSAFGTMFRDSISSFARDTSGAMITWIGPIVTAALSLYFLFMALNHLQGKSSQPITDTLFVCLKVSLIAFFALNAANFVSYVIEPVASLESLLISAIKTGVHGMPISGDNAWAALDEMWTQILAVGELIKQLIGKFGLGTLGPLLLSFLLLVAMFFCAGYFTFAAIGILLINEISVVLVLGFGPIYLSLLMFPVTRGWFDNWLKSLLTYVLTMVMTAAVIFLFCDVFRGGLEEIKNLAKLNAGAAVVLSRSLIPIVTFCVLLVAAATFQYRPGVNGSPGEEEVAEKNAQVAAHASPEDFKASGASNPSDRNFNSASSFLSEASSGTSSENHSGFAGTETSRNPMSSTPQEERTAQKNAAAASEYLRQGRNAGNVQSASGAGTSSASSGKMSSSAGEQTAAQTSSSSKAEEKTEFGLPKSDFPNRSNENKSTSNKTDKQSKEKK